MKKIDASLPFSWCQICNGIDAETVRATTIGQDAITWITCSHRETCELAEIAREKEKENFREID